MNEDSRKTTENKMSGESYLRNSIICKALFFKKIIFNENRLKADKGLIKRSFEKRPDVGG